MSRNPDYALVDGVELLGRGVLFEELGSDLALSCQNDSVLGQDTDGRASVRDGLEGIFDLIETALGREDGGL
jgi:hypothetical protein